MRDTAPTASLLPELRSLIEQARQHVAQAANRTLTMLYWKVGEPPIGLILCASADAEQVGLMDLGAANIRVAEYLDHMPDVKLMQAQLHRAVLLARERAAQGALPHAPKDEGEEPCA